jgi:hypothetical protein
MDKYETIALAKAKELGLTPGIVRQMLGVEIAALSDYTIGSKNPTDFFFQNIRRVVADTMQAEIDAIWLETQRAALVQAVGSDIALRELSVKTDPEGGFSLRKVAQVEVMR